MPLKRSGILNEVGRTLHYFVLLDVFQTIHIPNIETDTVSFWSRQGVPLTDYSRL